MRRSPVLNRNRRAARPLLPSPPSASVLPDATCGAAREKISPLGGMPSLQTSSRGPPSPFPTPRLRAPPARLPLLYPLFRPIRVEAQLPGRRTKTHLVGQFSAHRRVAEQHLQRQAIHERGEIRRKALRIAGPEVSGALALSYYLGDGVAPAALERLALAGRLLVAQSPRPQLDPERPVLVSLTPHHRRTGQLYQSHQPLFRTLDPGQLPKCLYIEKVLRVGERFGQKRLLGPEVVHHQSRTQSGPASHISDARLAQPPGGDHLHSSLQHLRAALLRQFGPRAHSPPTRYTRTCERLFNVQR